MNGLGNWFTVGLWYRGYFL